MLAKYGVESHCARISQENHFAYLSRLAGQIRYATSIEPSLGGKLTLKFDALFPDFDRLEALVRERPADTVPTTP